MKNDGHIKYNSNIFHCLISDDANYDITSICTYFTGHEKSKQYTAPEIYNNLFQYLPQTKTITTFIIETMYSERQFIMY
jgi:hypothetical protein